MRKQLDYLQRNLGAIDALIADGACLSALKRHWWHKLLACSELHRQQTILLHSKTRSIPDRLVNLVQRHVRPIVRGKARAAVEFGAKISFYVSNGFAFLHRASWDAYKEGEDLIAKAEKYMQDNGCYPNEYALIAFISMLRTGTTAIRTGFASLASVWEGLLRIQRSMQLTSNNSVLISAVEMKWRESLARASESIH